MGKTTKHSVAKKFKKLASSKLRQKVAIRNYESLTDSLTGVKCRATSVAKNFL